MSTDTDKDFKYANEEKALVQKRLLTYTSSII